MSEMNPLSARKQGRREFLKAGGAVTAALLAPGPLAPGLPARRPLAEGGPPLGGVIAHRAGPG